MVDFEKYSMISSLAEKKAVLHAVLFIDLGSKDGGLGVSGCFATESEALKALVWLEDNRPIKSGIYYIRKTPIKKWKGE